MVEQKQFRFVYKSRFQLYREEADFVCALGRLLKCDPDEALAVLVRMVAKQNPVLRKQIWDQAKEDHRGPWR